MTTEQEFRELLTDKLIEVAEQPGMRKEFSVIYDAVDGTSAQIFFYRNQPMMSSVENHAMILYALDKNDEETFAKVESMIEEVEDEWDKASLNLILLSQKAEYYQKIGDEEAYFDTKMEFFENSAIYTRKGEVSIDTLREYYDFLVKYEAWPVVYDFAVSLFKQANTLLRLYDILHDVPASDTDFQLLEQRGLPQEESELLRKVQSDFYVEKIIPKDFFDPVKRIEWYGTEEAEENIFNALSLAIAKAFELISTPKRPGPRFGSFDFLYKKAKKGDKKAIAAIAEAYRTGTGTHANQRLADYWQKRSE